MLIENPKRIYVNPDGTGVIAVVDKFTPLVNTRKYTEVRDTIFRAVKQVIACLKTDFLLAFKNEHADEGCRWYNEALYAEISTVLAQCHLDSPKPNQGRNR